MSDTAKCTICGEPMPVGEEMFKFHGYSGDCPKSPLQKPSIVNFPQEHQERVAEFAKTLLSDCESGEIVEFVGMGMLKDGGYRTFGSPTQNRFELIGFLMTVITDTIKAGEK